MKWSSIDLDMDDLPAVREAVPEHSTQLAAAAASWM